MSRLETGEPDCRPERTALQRLSVASLYYGTSNYIGNPIVPLKAGVTAPQAQLQGTTGVNAGKPVLNANDFSPSFVAPGTYGVPACDASGCDTYDLSSETQAATCSGVPSRRAST